MPADPHSLLALADTFSECQTHTHTDVKITCKIKILKYVFAETSQFDSFGVCITIMGI